MRALCKYNSGRSLTHEHLEEGYTLESEFDLQIGNEYSVYGIILSKRLLYYLLVGEGMYPHWYPAELFVITRSDLPPGWHFASFSEQDGYLVNAIWGYEELATRPDHFDDLSNLEPEAIEVFLRRKKEVDESAM